MFDTKKKGLETFGRIFFHKLENGGKYQDFQKAIDSHLTTKYQDPDEFDGGETVGHLSFPFHLHLSLWVGRQPLVRPKPPNQRNKWKGALRLRLATLPTFFPTSREFFSQKTQVETCLVAFKTCRHHQQSGNRRTGTSQRERHTYLDQAPSLHLHH